MIFLDEANSDEASGMLFPEIFSARIYTVVISVSGISVILIVSIFFLFLVQCHIKRPIRRFVNRLNYRLYLLECFCNSL